MSERINGRSPSMAAKIAGRSREEEIVWIRGQECQGVQYGGPHGLQKMRMVQADLEGALDRLHSHTPRSIQITPVETQEWVYSGSCVVRHTAEVINAKMRGRSAGAVGITVFAIESAKYWQCGDVVSRSTRISVIAPSSKSVQSDSARRLCLLARPRGHEERVQALFNTRAP